MSRRSPLIFLIAGEASGDQLGADLMASLKSLQEVRFAGIGGERMAAQGLQSLFPMQELSLIGLVSILRDLPNLWQRLRFTVKTIQSLKPDVVITIDTPEFSLRVMKHLHKMPEKPQLIHYVAPTVWAWRPGLAKKVAGFLDHLLCLYPFEPPYFEKHGLKATFVGHPAAKEDVPKTRRDPNLLCLLPGSRRSEIAMLLPVFAQTIRVLQKDVPDLKVILPTLPSVEPLVRERVQDWPLEVQVVVGDEARQEAFQKATVALAASGTVALQLSAARLPCVIAYKVGKINEWGARLLLNTPWVCMVNILLAFQKFGPSFVLSRRAKALIPKPWVPEFIQQNCTAEKMASALAKFLKDKKAREAQIQAMEKAISLLKASPHAAAKAVTEALAGTSNQISA